MSIKIVSVNNTSSENSMEQISGLIKAGFKAKFTKKLFSNQEASKVIAAFCEYIVLEKPEKLFVAEVNGKLCGCVFLTTKGEKYHGLNSSLKKSLTFSQRCRLFFLLGFLSHDPQPDEKYIDFIAVSSEFRNKGVGKALIYHCSKLFSKKKLILYVAKENAKAFRLYSKVGFRIIKQQSSYTMGIVTGLRDWRLMKWE